MFLMFKVILCLSLFSLVLSTPSNLRTRFVVHEKRNGLPHWNYQKLKTRSHEETTIPIRIALAQRNLHRGYELLMDVSDPTSKNFGKHWTAQEVHDMFSPSQESVKAVKEWLISSGVDASKIQHVGVTKGLHFDATVKDAEALLNTKYHAYKDVWTGEEHISCDHYSIPEHLRGHIELITPTTSVMKQHRNSLTNNQKLLNNHLSTAKPTTKLASRSKLSTDLSNDLSKCNETIAPQCIKALYKIPDGSKAAPGNELGIAEWIDTLESKSLSKFLRNLTNIPSDMKPKIVTIDGGEHARLKDNITTAAHTESNLDFQVSMPIIYPQNAILYQVGDDVQGQDFDDLLLAWDPDFAKLDGGDNIENNVYPTPEQLLRDPSNPSIKETTYKGFTGKKQVGGVKRPNVFSSSYGLPEEILSPAYQNRQCNEYMKLGLMGTSVLYATGDSGVGSGGGCIPLKNDTASIASAANGQSGRFVPDFPANCPYITAVGGTMLKPGKGVEAGEMAVNAPTLKNVTINLAGGGGFSEIFPRPDYQKAAVTSYLKNFPPPYNASQFKDTGRAYPDISAASLNLNFATQGGILTTTGFGTSIAAPLVAGIITRINEERLAVNKSTVGFLNPVLYANPGALNDIVEGSNPGCGTAGFRAASGWDASTGLGTPDFEKLLKVFMALP